MRTMRSSDQGQTCGGILPAGPARQLMPAIHPRISCLPAEIIDASTHRAPPLVIPAGSWLAAMRSTSPPLTRPGSGPPPYHACHFRAMASHRVGLPQPRRILASGYVALRLTLTGGVVTWFVTGSATRPGLPEIGNELLSQRPSSSGCSGAADGSSGSRLIRSRSVLAKSSPTHSSGSPATEATA
jgi:hypothetical protein